MLREQDKDRIIVLLTGSTPGTGASSLKYSLVNERNDETLRDLELKDLPSAGYYRRSLAFQWYLESFSCLTPEEEQAAWTKFSARYETAFIENDLVQTAHNLYTLLFQELQGDMLERITSTDDYLTFFNRDQQLFGAQENFWDKIPEILSYSLLNGTLSYEGIGPDTNVIYEGKLAIIVDELIGHLPTQGVTVIRLLTEVDPETSAHRVLRRSIVTGSVNYGTISKETLTDWWDGKISSIDGYSNEELAAWRSELLEETKIRNAARMSRDQRVYAQTYDKPADSFAPLAMAERTGATVIDAEPPLQEVKTTAISIIKEALKGSEAA